VEIHRPFDHARVAKLKTHYFKRPAQMSFDATALCGEKAPILSENLKDVTCLKCLQAAAEKGFLAVVNTKKCEGDEHGT